MIKEAIGTGATLDEAKEAALKALEAPEDADIKYEVLERPQKKVLGLFGGSPAKVKACYEYEEVKADDFTAAKAYLNNILVNLGVNDAEIEIEADSEDVRINISCGVSYPPRYQQRLGRIQKSIHQCRQLPREEREYSQSPCPQECG